MKKLFFALFLIAFLCFDKPCFGWGLTGHRVVAEIADHHLSKKARKNIQAILGQESLAMAANWADFIKSDPSFNYLSSWHYVNFKSGLTEAQLLQQLHLDTVANAYNKLNMLVKAFKENPSLDQPTKVMYLRLIIHMVGDLHQPMHTGRLEDLGGNRVQLFWFNSPTNLHRIWDEQLIDFQQLSYTEYAHALDTLTTQQLRAWQQEPLENWIYQSYQLAENLYRGVQPEEKLSYRYNFDYLNTLNQQLLKGGIHLAALLNDLFG